MPFLKDDKETADGMKKLVHHFADGKEAAELRYIPEFANLQDVRKSTHQALSEVADSFNKKGQAELGQSHIPYSMSEASMHVEILDEIVLARANSVREKE